jgi:hypothetical protein
VQPVIDKKTLASFQKLFQRRGEREQPVAAHVALARERHERLMSQMGIHDFGHSQSGSVER